MSLIRFAGEAAAEGWWCEEETGMFAARSREAEHHGMGPGTLSRGHAAALQGWKNGRETPSTLFARCSAGMTQNPPTYGAGFFQDRNDSLLA